MSFVIECQNDRRDVQRSQIDDADCQKIVMGD